MYVAQDGFEFNILWSLPLKLLLVCTTTSDFKVPD